MMEICYKYNAVGDEIKNYLFVDGGAFRSILNRLSTEYFNREDLFNIIDFEKMASIFTKVFYYDCYIPEPEKDTPEHRELLEKQIELFNRMRNASGFHVIEGITRKHAKKNIQKGVDVNIAVDMLMHTYRRNMDHTFLLTGDADFIPLVKSLVNEGMYVTLIYDKRSASDDLLLEVDNKIAIDFELLKKWIDSSNLSRFVYKISSTRIATAEAGSLVDEGYIQHDSKNGFTPKRDFQGKDATVNLYKKDDVFCLDIAFIQEHNYCHYFSKELGIFRFFLDSYGYFIKWNYGIINNSKMIESSL